MSRLPSNLPTNGQLARGCDPHAAWTTRTLIVAYLAIGGGLSLQPDRFANTPSYRNLLILIPSQGWGAIYLTVVALLVALQMVHPVWLAVSAHVAALMLTLFWLFAFVIRYETDDGTTIVNVVSWAVFLALVLRSSAAVVRSLRPSSRAEQPAA